MAEPKYKQQTETRITPINNDFANKGTKKIAYSKQHKIRRRRRIAILLPLAGMVIFGLGNMTSKQYDRLHVKEQNKNEVLAELEEIQEVQQMLQLQIAKLEDDDYITKLARKEYFMSEEGEIVFTIPRKEQQDKEDEK